MLIFKASRTVCFATDSGAIIKVFSFNNLAHSSCINVFPNPVSKNTAALPFLMAQKVTSLWKSNNSGFISFLLTSFPMKECFIVLLFKNSSYLLIAISFYKSSPYYFKSAGKKIRRGYGLSFYENYPRSYCSFNSRCH